MKPVKISPATDKPVKSPSSIDATNKHRWVETRNKALENDWVAELEEEQSVKVREAMDWDPDKTLPAKPENDWMAQLEEEQLRRAMEPSEDEEDTKPRP